MKISGVHILFIFFFAAKISFCPAATPDTLTPLITYKHFGEEDGLHCKTVYEVIQDKEGFLWFATDAGVFRFDGKKFKQYNIEHGVTDKEVLKIFQDSYGRIWFLTLNGHLSFWKDGRIYNPSNTPFLKKAYTGSAIFTYFEDSKRRIWLGTPTYDFIVIAADSVTLLKSPAAAGSDMSSFNVYEDESGNMWTFSKYKMFMWPGKHIGDTIRLPQQFHSGYRGKKRNEAIYWTNERRAYKLTGKTFSLYADEKLIPPDVKVINLVWDEGLWFCTAGNGCFKVVNGRRTEEHMDNMAVTSVFRDRENNLWFNTIGHGVYMLPSGSDLVRNYNQQSGLSANNVTAFAAGMKGEFWLGYNNGTVERIEDSKATRFAFDIPVSGNTFNRVTGIIPDSDMTFCGTDAGCYYIYKNQVHFILSDASYEFRTKQAKFPREYVVKQLLLSQSKDVYVAHASGLLKILKNDTGYFARSMINPYERTFAVSEFVDGHFLISTSTGLMEYVEAKDLAAYKTDVDFSSIRVLDIKSVSANMFVLATNGNGIYFLKNKKLYQHLSISNGLSDNNCKRIFISDSTMYVATDKGLNILTMTNERWSVLGVITTKNGLLSNTVNDVAEKDGIIYVATEKGLSVFDIADIFPEKFIGRAYVTDIVTDSAYIVADTMYDFKADIPRLLIRFAYPVFSPENELKVRYRLVHDKTDNSGWILSENNEIEFSALSPGQYIFQLKPDATSASDAQTTSLYINIIPLWWQTNAARVIFILLSIGLIIFIVRRWIQYQYKKQLRQLAMLEAERSRIASDMHDDIGADLTQLSIWSGILKSSEKNDNHVLERITNSSNDVLQKMDQIIWALNSFHSNTSDLVSYLREFALQYLDSAGIRLSYEPDEKLPDFKLSAIVKRNVFLTVKELLHNTVKHSGATDVSIKIYNVDSILHIEYKDNGRGFVTKDKEDGLGNITIQKRMKEIDSEIYIKSNYGEGFAAHLKISVSVDHLKVPGK